MYGGGRMFESGAESGYIRMKYHQGLKSHISHRFMLGGDKCKYMPGLNGQ